MELIFIDLIAGNKFGNIFVLSQQPLKMTSPKKFKFIQQNIEN